MCSWMFSMPISLTRPRLSPGAMAPVVLEVPPISYLRAVSGRRSSRGRRERGILQ